MAILAVAYVKEETNPVVNAVDCVPLICYQNAHVKEYLVELQHGSFQLPHLVMPLLHIAHELFHLQLPMPFA